MSNKYFSWWFKLEICFFMVYQILVLNWWYFFDINSVDKKMEKEIYYDFLRE